MWTKDALSLERQCAPREGSSAIAGETRSVDFDWLGLPISRYRMSINIVLSILDG